MAAQRKKRILSKYIVTARIKMQSGRISKTTADKMKRDIKRKSPSASVTIRKV